MRKIGHLIFTLFLTLNLPYATAINFLTPPTDKAGICWLSFKNPLNPKKSIYSDWPLITDPKRPLPESTRERVLSHPKIKELKALYKKGRSLTFDFAYLGQESSHKGEYIQRVFLIKILKLIFPQAKIVTRNYNTRFDSLYPFNQSSKVHVSLEIADIRESMKFVTETDFEKYLYSHKRLVDMVLLKIANSSQKDLPSEYKKSFPAFEKNSVLSLYLPEKYLNYSHTYTYEDLQEESVDLFHILDEFLSMGFRKVFLTSHFNSRLSQKTKDQFLSALSTRFDKIRFLSQVSRKEFSEIQDQDKVIFFNDLTGYTSVLHSLADVAFIFGPINIMEGLFLDARMIFMNKGEPLSSSPKYRLAFDQLKQTALRTNRAVYIEHLEEAEEALHFFDQLALKPLVYPDEVIINPLKGSALDQLMERLHFQITEHAFLSNNRFAKRF